MTDPATPNFPEGTVTQMAYVVRDIERHAASWTELTGAGPWFHLEPELRNMVYRSNPTDAKYRLAMAFVGSTLLELIQPLDDEPSIFKEILDERGEGFHHIAPRLSGLSGASFEARCLELEQQGLTLALANDVVGQGRTAFYDAKDTIGGFVEVFELGAGYSMLPRMAEVHQQWDGTDLMRPLQSLFSSLNDKEF